MGLMMSILKVEVADNAAEMAKGLMFRKELDEDAGMLFKFPTCGAAFWGKNTFLPLDIAFVDHNNTITSIKKIVPLSTKLVRSEDHAVMAIEANAGYFAKHSIQPGHKVVVNDGIVEFKHE